MAEQPAVLFWTVGRHGGQNENDSHGSLRLWRLKPPRGDDRMAQTWLISGPPGCGKTTWMLNALKTHKGTRGYLRLAGCPAEGLEHGFDSGIDLAYLQDQIPDLRDLSKSAQTFCDDAEDLLALIELPQFHSPEESGTNGLDPRVKPQLEELALQPDRVLHFGHDEGLPRQDTLEFSQLEAWSCQLQGRIWDPNSLSSFWFELVNGAYGDVYRAKGLMNLPDGRAFFCNWMVSQNGSQFLPLEQVAPPDGRPNRISALVVQGKALDSNGIRSTIADCLLTDAVLEMHQAPLRERQSQPTPAN